MGQWISETRKFNKFYADAGSDGPAFWNDEYPSYYVNGGYIPFGFWMPGTQNDPDYLQGLEYGISRFYKSYDLTRKVLCYKMDIGNNRTAYVALYNEGPFTTITNQPLDPYRPLALPKGQMYCYNMFLTTDPDAVVPEEFADAIELPLEPLDNDLFYVSEVSGAISDFIRGINPYGPQNAFFPQPPHPGQPSFNDTYYPITDMALLFKPAEHIISSDNPIRPNVYDRETFTARYLVVPGLSDGVYRLVSCSAQTNGSAHNVPDYYDTDNILRRSGSCITNYAERFDVTGPQILGTASPCPIAFRLPNPSRTSNWEQYKGMYDELYAINNAFVWRGGEDYTLGYLLQGFYTPWIPELKMIIPGYIPVVERDPSAVSKYVYCKGTLPIINGVDLLNTQ